MVTEATVLATLGVLALLAQAAQAAPFFPEEREGAWGEERTHGLIKRKKKVKQQLLCSLLQSPSQPQPHGRTFDLLLGDGGGGYGGYGGGGGGLCGSQQGGGSPIGGGPGGGFPGGGFPGGGFPGGGLPGGGLPGGGLPGGGLPGGGLLSESQEILSSVVGLVGAVSQAGGGAVSGLLGGVRPQRYLRPIYRSFRPLFRLL